IRALIKSANLRDTQVIGTQAGDARIVIIAAQIAGLGEFCRSAFGFAPEGIGGSEASVNIGQSGTGAARLLEPVDRLVDTRLQQVRQADPAKPYPNHRIARAEANGLPDERDIFFDRSRIELALAEIGIGVDPVAIEIDRYFVFGDGFREPVL